MKLLNAHILRFVLCAFFCLVGWQNIQAQSNVGVIWEPSVDDISFEERLSFFDEHHISILIIQGELNTAQQSLLAQYNLPFLIDLDYRFLSQSTAQK